MNWKLMALTEAVFILGILLLVIFRKIGRPLSEAEAKYRIDKKLQKERDKKLKRQEEDREARKAWDKHEEQEVLISKMKTPIILISAKGDARSGVSMCVKDGEGKIENLHVEACWIDKFPKFLGLYHALPYGYKNGMVLVP